MSWNTYQRSENPSEQLEKFLNILNSRIQESESLPELMTKDEAMKILKCTQRTLRYYLHDEKSLNYMMVGRSVRIKRSDLKDFIEKRMKTPG